MGMLALATTLALAMSPFSQDAAAAEVLPEKTKVTIQFLGGEARVPLPYEPVNGLILFKAQVAGRHVWMLLDNRAESSMIDIALARAAGLAIGEPQGVVRTPTATLPKRRVRDVSLVLPGQLEARLPLTAFDLEPISKLMGRKIEAVLGGDLLGHFGVIANSGRRTLQFGPSGGVRFPPVMQPVSLLNARPQLEVTIAGKTMRVTLDLGATTGLGLTPEAWARLGMKEVKFGSAIGAHGEGDLHMTDIAEVPEVKIGHVTRRNVKVSVRPFPAEDGDGIAGMGLLAGADFALDIKAGKLWFIPRLPSAPAQ